jgi:uroporphyrinogen decarboxylase
MATRTTKAVDFEGMVVVSFESRRAKEMAALISKFHGNPLVAPSMREVRLEDNPAAFEFVERLLKRQLDGVIFMTGVGARTLIEVLETRYSRDEMVEALSKVTVVARGPKAAKVLQDLRVPVTISIPEPNTWREILEELDESPRGFTLDGSRVAVQEYGISNKALLRELAERGAEVLRVPVYRWTLPEDISPLRQAINAVIDGRARVALFTTATQVYHLVQVASQDGLKGKLLEVLQRCVVCSVGPTCSEALLANGIRVDLEPLHSKMGELVHEAAKRASDLLKRQVEGAPNPSAVAVRPPVTVPAERAAVPLAGPWTDSRFMKACRLEPTDATPVWLMRQAGRYMKEYRDLRARVPFLELCKNPDLVAEVTVTAAEMIGADAAIIFADLLLIVEPLGFGLEYGKGEGPVVRPALRKSVDVDRLCEVEAQDSLAYLYEATRRTRAALNPKTPLLGFAGAPFTLASYIIEGGASRNYIHTKAFMYRDPGAWRALMKHLVRNLIVYLNRQVAAGVQAVQVFDTWVGCLGPDDYRQFVLPYTRELIRGITPGVPVIHFGTDTAMLLEGMRDAGGHIIGLDFRVELDQAWARLGEGVGVQGNLDPIVLYAEPSYIRRRVERILGQAGGRSGHIFNLGHGILPDTPFENVVELIKMVHEISSQGKDANR